MVKGRKLLRRVSIGGWKVLPVHSVPAVPAVRDGKSDLATTHPINPDPLIPWSLVRTMVGVGRTTVWRLRKAGLFPAPRLIGQRQVWFTSEIVAWQSSLPVAGAV